MFFGDPRIELGGIEAAAVTPGEVCGEQQIHPVGLVADFLLDPVHLHLEILERVSRDPQHPQTSGLGDGGGHVATMGKREARECESHLLREP